MLFRSFGKSFSFNVLHHNIVALIGEEGREAFYSNPHLDFNEGYKLLMGAVRVSPTPVTERSIDTRDIRPHVSVMWTKQRKRARKGT